MNGSDTFAQRRDSNWRPSVKAHTLITTRPSETINYVRGETRQYERKETSEVLGWDGGQNPGRRMKW